MEPSEKDRLVQQLKETTQQVCYWKQIAKRTGKLRLRESENLSYIIQALKQTKTKLLDEIDERKSAEGALRESEERYRSFFKNNHSIMLLIDLENADIIDANPAAISYYGWSHEELTGKKITDINILTKEKVFREMERAKKEQRQHFYFRHRLSNGEIRDVEVYSGPITIHNKNFLYSIIFDTTDRKLAQSALIESERELKIKAKDLEELNAALKVLLNKRQEDKEELEEGILSNVRTLIEPYIVKLKRSKLPQSQKTLLNILESNLNEIVSPFTRKLSSKYLNLTPTQIQVANLVKHGKTNKDISEILHVSGRTIAFHRENIRKKLDLTNKKTNLKTYLMSID
jgi:PAS domain S-box-containing protein